MDSKSFREQYKLTEEEQKKPLSEMEKNQKYLSEKVFSYTTSFVNSHSADVKEYMDYLVSAIFLKFKQYYPNLSIYIPFRAKSDMSFLRNLTKEISNQFSEGKVQLDDDKIISDINAITVVLDHTNPTIPVNPNYDYRRDPTINSLFKQSNTLALYIDEIEPSINGLLSKKEFLDNKKDILTKIIEVNFDKFTHERTPSYVAELQDVENALKDFEDIGAYASPEEITALNNLLNELRSKLYDKAYYTLLPKAFENVMKDPLLVEKLHVKFEFVKDSQKQNGFAANYYVLSTPFGNIEVQLQSIKRYYEARKGTAAHNSIPGKNLDIKNLFELVDPNDENSLEYYLEILDKTPVTKTQYDASISGKYSPEYIESERIKELLKHIKLKDYYIHEDPYDKEAPKSITPIAEYIYRIASSNSPYMGMCRSAHTNFRNADVTHRSKVAAYSDILRKIDTLSCLGDIVVGCLRDYINESKNNSSSLHTDKKSPEPDTDKVTEVSMQSILQYASDLDKIIKRQNNPSILEDDSHTL